MPVIGATKDEANAAASKRTVEEVDTDEEDGSQTLRKQQKTAHAMLWVILRQTDPNTRQ
ncbi:MAG: hypothetical protein Q9179_007077, partial [Wetmoreana sp. 5 TL-2023]